MVDRLHRHRRRARRCWSLACCAAPLWRHSPLAGRGVIAGLAPGARVLLCTAIVGTPAALDPAAARTQPETLADAIAQTRSRTRARSATRSKAGVCSAAPTPPKATRTRRATHSRAPLQAGARRSPTCWSKHAESRALAASGPALRRRRAWRCCSTRWRATRAPARALVPRHRAAPGRRRTPKPRETWEPLLAAGRCAHRRQPAPADRRRAQRCRPAAAAGRRQRDAARAHAITVKVALDPALRRARTAARRCQRLRDRARPRMARRCRSRSRSCAAGDCRSKSRSTTATARCRRRSCRH